VRNGTPLKITAQHPPRAQQIVPVPLAPHSERNTPAFSFYLWIYGVPPTEAPFASQFVTFDAE
jgi:hypothetical protein